MSRKTWAYRGLYTLPIKYRKLASPKGSDIVVPRNLSPKQAVEFLRKQVVEKNQIKCRQSALSALALMRKKEIQYDNKIRDMGT